MTYLPVRVSGGVLRVLGCGLAAVAAAGSAGWLCVQRTGWVLKSQTVATPRLKQGRVMGGQQPVSGATLQLCPCGGDAAGMGRRRLRCFLRRR